MDVDAVPQEGNATHAGVRKAIYARDADGRMVIAPSRGWEVEEIVTSQAVDAMQTLALAAQERVLAGVSSPLEYWMYACRMDVALLSQTSGFWQWRVRRHLRPEVFAKLSESQLQRYSNALGIAVDALKKLS